MSGDVMRDGQDNLLHAEITAEILNCFYHVYNTLGYGFLEKVYANAMCLSLNKRDFLVEPQAKIHVFFEGQIVGEYFADLLVNKLVILELKAVEALNPAHEAQLTNYLKATGIEVGLLLNLGPKPAFKRKVFTRQQQPPLQRRQEFSVETNPR